MVIRLNFSVFIRRQNFIRTAGFYSAIILAVFTFAFIFPFSDHAADAEATVLPSSTNLTITSSSTISSVDLSVQSSNGTFAASTSDVAFSITTNNLTGYTLTIAGNDNNGQLANPAASSVLDPLTSAISTETFSNASNTTYNGKWGYKPSKLNSSANTNYLPAPTTTATTLDTTSSANTTANSYTIGIGARADYTKPAGTYTNTFVLAAVGRPVPYEINYLDNTNDSSVSGLPSQEASNISTVSGFTLSSSTPTRTGYTFNKWCLGTVTHIAGGDSTCSGTEYAAGADFAFNNPSVSSTNIANLYAMWNALLYIQDYTTSTCQANASSSNVTVYDKRDGNDYQVRYINGNCWMVQNLRYVGDTGSSSGSMTMKSDTSNISADTTITYTDLTSGNTYDAARIHVATSSQVPSGATYTAEDMGVWYNYAAVSAMSITGSSNQNAQVYDICPKGWRLPTGGTNSEQAGITSYSDAYQPVTGGYYVNGTLYRNGYGRWWSSTSQSTTDRHGLRWESSRLGLNHYYRYDGYYVRCIRNNSSVNITFDGNGATGGSMRKQVINGSSSNSPSGTLNTNQFTRDGYHFIGWNTQPDGSGTSYADGGDYIYPTSESEGDINVTLYAQWFDGPTMQDFTKSMCKDQASSHSVNVIDIRDGNIYSVRYFGVPADECWMVQNLRFKGESSDSLGTMTLDSNTSNIIPNTIINYADLTNGDSYDEARIHVGTDDSGNPTVWYNYAAASAMTITGSTNGNDAYYDVCPSGWELPSHSQQSNVNDGWVSEWLPVGGGVYAGGILYDYSSEWWSSSKYGNVAIRYTLGWRDPNFTHDVNTTLDRQFGAYIRCVRKEYSTLVTFNGNGATGGDMAPQTINEKMVPNTGLLSRTYGTLKLNTFTRNGYYFVGWNTAADGSGTSYSDGGIYTNSILGDTTVTLYAQWFDGATTMQDLTNSVCQDIASSNSIQAIDVRDNNIYDVRYINGNCWMTQNLRYVGDSGSTSTSMIMKAATSNIASDQNLTIGDLTSGNNYNEARIHIGTDGSGNPTTWYNYAAASAGAITDSSNTTDATQDICPKGWRLPTNSEQYSIANYKNAYSPVTGGYYNVASLGGAGFGYWWSATPYSGNSSYRYFLFYNGSTLTTSTNDRGVGFYVRCIRSS